MSVQLTKDSIDLGIVVADPEASLAFYRDTLGLEYKRKLDMPGGMTMHQLSTGGSVVKIVSFEKTPESMAPPGGIGGARGYRYFTLSVSNLDQATAEVEKAGYKVTVAPRDIAPGTRISIFEDPDGNWVELLQVGG